MPTMEPGAVYMPWHEDGIKLGHELERGQQSRCPKPTIRLKIRIIVEIPDEPSKRTEMIAHLQAVRF